VLIIYLGILAFGVIAIIFILLEEQRSRKPKPSELLESLEIDEPVSDLSSRKNADAIGASSSFLDRLRMAENKSKESKKESELPTPEAEEKPIAAEEVVQEIEEPAPEPKPTPEPKPEPEPIAQPVDEPAIANDKPQTTNIVEEDAIIDLSTPTENKIDLTTSNLKSEPESAPEPEGLDLSSQSQPENKIKLRLDETPPEPETVSEPEGLDLSSQSQPENEIKLRLDETPPEPETVSEPEQKSPKSETIDEKPEPEEIKLSSPSEEQNNSDQAQSEDKESENKNS